MNSTRSFTLVRFLVLALLAACFNAGLASAQVSAGKFTLPFETRWGRAVLPAGDYSFTLASGSLPAIVTVRGEGNAAMIMATGGTSQGRISDQSALFVVRSGGKATVRSMYLEHLGLTFYYTAPKAGKQLVAQKPELIQPIPISVAGK